MPDSGNYAPNAEYKQLGKSGLRVSVPILGAMSFGDSRWQPWVINEDKALPLLKAAYDKGLNTVRPTSQLKTCESADRLAIVGYGQHLQ